MAERNRIVISGNIAAGVESWSVGLNVAGDGGVFARGSAELSTWATAVFDAVQGNAVLMTALSTACTLERVDAYYYQSEGPAFEVGASTQSSVAGTGGASKTPQTAVVASLLTAQAGRSFRGRIYWPALGVPIQTTDLRISASLLEDLAEAFATLIAEVNTTAPLPGQLVSIYSQTRDLMTPVISARVGNVLDTQRRRRESMVEVYEQAPVPDL